MQILGRTGGSLCSHPSLFSTCSKYLFVPVGGNIKVVDVEGGNVIRLLSWSVQSEITQIILNPGNPGDQLISVSVNGAVLVWNWKSGEVIRYIRTGQPIHSTLVRSFDVETETLELIVVSLRLKAAESGQSRNPDPKRLFNYCGQRMTSGIHSLSLNLKTGSHNMKQLAKANGISRLALSAGGDDLLFTSRCEVKFARFVEDSLEVYRVLEHTSIITNLQYHPTEPCLVISDVMGQIVLWYCLRGTGSQQQQSPQRTLHWHANEVTGFCFTSSGQFLLSGGEEAVLVLWQIESGTRQYLPRLGEPIHFITVSSDDRWAAVATRDNVIHLISLMTGSALTIIHRISGSRAARDHRSICASPCLIACGAQTQDILVSSTPGTLQYFDPIADRSQGSLEIASQNRRTGFRTLSLKQRTLEVVKTSISPCGNWMVTLEQRRSSRKSQAVLTARLKFWGRSDGANQSGMTLLSSVDRPHSNLVTDLCCWRDEDGMPWAASSSRDGTFRVWGINLQQGIWSCKFVGSYRDRVALGGGCSSVSVRPDGQVLAVSYGAAVTLWSLKDYRLMDALVASQTAEIKEAKFVGNDGLVAVCPNNGLFTFLKSESSVSYKLSWHAPVTAFTDIAVHPESAQFAVLVENDNESVALLTYAVQSPLPIGYCFLPKRSSMVSPFIAMAYIPSPEAIKTVRNSPAESHLLVLLDNDGQFTVLSTESTARLVKSDLARTLKASSSVPVAAPVANAERIKSLYKVIFEGGSDVENPAKGASWELRAQTAKHSMADLFSAFSQKSRDELLLPSVASHTLPPVNLLFSHFIQNTMVKKKIY